MQNTSHAVPRLSCAGYGVVLADPPWRFDTWSGNGHQKSPERHYKTMDYDEIVALKDVLGIDFVCAPDCVLVIWATFPKLPQALDLMAAWGFAYKTGGPWAKVGQSGKQAFGTGYIFRNAAELWLVGTRGAPPVRSRSIRNLIIAPRREHSRKPDDLYEMIERLFYGPYIELFARRRRHGWDAWGDQIEEDKHDD